MLECRVAGLPPVLDISLYYCTARRQWCWRKYLGSCLLIWEPWTEVLDPGFGRDSTAAGFQGMDQCMELGLSLWLLNKEITFKYQS